MSLAYPHIWMVAWIDTDFWVQNHCHAELLMISLVRVWVLFSFSGGFLDLDDWNIVRMCPDVGEGVLSSFTSCNIQWIPFTSTCSVFPSPWGLLLCWLSDDFLLSIHQGLVLLTPISGFWNLYLWTPPTPLFHVLSFFFLYSERFPQLYLPDHEFRFSLFLFCDSALLLNVIFCQSSF